MYIVVSVTIITGSLEAYRAIGNYNRMDKFIDKLLLIGVPVIFLSAAILGLLATCWDNSSLLCPLLIIFVSSYHSFINIKKKEKKQSALIVLTFSF